MPKSDLVPGKMVNKAPRMNLDIVGPKGKNLSGTPRFANANPKTKPGKKGFDKIRHFNGSGRGR